MFLAINISEEDYEEAKMQVSMVGEMYESFNNSIKTAVANGTILPDEKKVIYQLESLREHCIEMKWQDDIDTLTSVINVLNNKKDSEEQVRVYTDYDEIEDIPEDIDNNIDSEYNDTNIIRRQHHGR